MNDRTPLVTRRAKVLELYNDDVSASRIATLLGVPHSTIQGDITLLRSRGQIRKKRNYRGPTPAVATRRAEVARQWDEGATGPAIALQLGVSLATVNADVQHLRGEGRAGRRSRNLNGEWDNVQRMWNHGFSTGDIATALDSSPDAIRHLMQRMRDSGVDLWDQRDPRRLGMAADGEAA